MDCSILLFKNIVNVLWGCSTSFNLASTSRWVLLCNSIFKMPRFANISAEKMNFVMGKLAKLLKTKDTCQICTVLIMTFVLIVLIILVMYT